MSYQVRVMVGGRQQKAGDQVIENVGRGVATLKQEIAEM